MRLGLPILLAVAACFTLPTDSTAQPNENYWGVQASFAPKWEVRDAFKKLFDADVADISGKEFRIGFARGRTLGSDWGVTYVRKSLKNGSRALTPDVERTTHNVVVSGVSIDKFSPFGTIKDRVQIGMTYGIGVASAKGDVIERDRLTGATGVIEAKHFFSPFGVAIPVVPLGEVQLAVAFIGGPGFKVRASGGLNYPGTTVFTITGVYLFGEK